MSSCPPWSLGFLVHNAESSIQLPEFLQNLLKTTQTSSKRWKASAPLLPLPTLRWALLTLPLVLDHGTMHLGQEPIFHSDMYFLHVIPNERRITHVFVSLNAAPTKVWACASSKDCQLEDISGFLVNQVSLCCQACQLSLP